MTKESGYITIRLDAADRDKLQLLATAAERSVSAEIRLAVRGYLQDKQSTLYYDPNTGTTTPT